MIKINHSFVSIADQISELRHIEQAANRSNESIKIKIRNILENYSIEFEISDECEFK